MTTVTATFTHPSWGRRLSWFFLPPILALLVGVMLLATLVLSYEQKHQERFYTGVMLWGTDISGLTFAEAQQSLNNAFPYANQPVIGLRDPSTAESWTLTPAEMGLQLDVDASLANAFQIGRTGTPAEQILEQFQVWYYGRSLPPVIILDEGRFDEALAAIAAEIDRPAADSSLNFDGIAAEFSEGATGRILDRADARSRLLQPIADFQAAQIDLVVHDIVPRASDAAAASDQIALLSGSPMSLFVSDPLDNQDLNLRVDVSEAQLSNWIRIRPFHDADGALRHEIFIDEVAVRNWLTSYEPFLYREPTNARYYFDDASRELVLVEPHINGRSLDIDATVAQFMATVGTPNRSLPFAVQPVIPIAHSNATAAELGITELVSESTTWFYGSSAARRHNIARSASNFYGIVIGPGEEFSFNDFLGNISVEDGYETGLIILGGRTIEGVGGGVCQVSTTVFQSAFWAGFPIVERQEHGYRVPYYDDGEGAGMDATIFSPLVDLRFINNTPYHLIIENYYNEVNQSLWVKFYSTSLGREIVKNDPVVTNIQPVQPDQWVENGELAPGEVRQVDWAIEGADYSVRRVVRNANGDLLLDDNFISNYIPWQNVYEYGPGTDIQNFDLRLLDN